MSNELLTSLRFVSVDPTAKFVLMVMADIADNNGRLYPSIDYLSDCTCLNRTSVTRAISRLEALGYVEAFRQNGRKTTYKIHQKPDEQSNRLHKVTGCTKHRHPMNKASAPDEQSHTKHQEPSITITTARDCSDAKPASSAQHLSVDLFDKFWAAYPKKKSKESALRAWKKLAITPDDPRIDLIRNALQAQKKSRDWLKDSGQFIPYPATWLNGKLWEDEIDAAPQIDPTTGDRIVYATGVAL